MTVIGVSMVRDEADIIGHTVRHMLRHVDEVIVADNGSIDGTRETLEQIDRCTIVDDLEVAYYQSRKMSALAARAATEGADWVVPFDADEFWLPHTGTIKQALEALDDHIVMCDVALTDHVATADDPDDPNPVTRMGWRRTQQAPLCKVAIRPLPGVEIHQGNHGATFPTMPSPASAPDVLQVRHFPYRSPEQMVRKALNGREAYAATDLPSYTGQHWRRYAALVDQGGPETLHDVFHQWFWSKSPATDPTLVYDPVPAC